MERLLVLLTSAVLAPAYFDGGAYTDSDGESDDGTGVALCCNFTGAKICDVIEES